MKHFFLRENILLRSYLPSHLRRRNDTRDQLVVPTSLRKLVVSSCHDLLASECHLAFKGAFDKVRDRLWWPTIHTHVGQHVDTCLSCQHRKTSRRPPITRGTPASYTSISMCSKRFSGNRYILSMIDHLTRFDISIPIKNKEATTVVRMLVEHVFSVLGPLDTLPSDQGKEFEIQLVKELQIVLGYREILTAADRPQGNYDLERVYSTVHDMVAMYSTLACDNWVDMLPFVSLAHNTAYSSTHEETPYYLVSGRAAVLPVDLILGVPATPLPQCQLGYSRGTVDILQLAYELARRNLEDRADKQATKNEKLSFPAFKPGDQVLINRPHHGSDGPNPKIYSPWHGPYTVRTNFSQVIYRVTKEGATTEITLHLG